MSGKVTITTILWSRLDLPGHESAQLMQLPFGWQLTGTAVFLHDRHPCRLEYQILCSTEWQTQSAKVAGWVGDSTIDIDLAVDSTRHWRLNNDESPQVEGCIDVDLNFSPSTNLLPIRRLDMKVGQSVPTKAAWLRFPSFRLEPLEQVYYRLGETSYRYESNGGRFAAELQVNRSGFVTDYPNIWTIETG